MRQFQRRSVRYQLSTQASFWALVSTNGVQHVKWVIMKKESHNIGSSCGLGLRLGRVNETIMALSVCHLEDIKIWRPRLDEVTFSFPSCSTRLRVNRNDYACSSAAFLAQLSSRMCTHLWPAPSIFLLLLIFLFPPKEGKRLEKTGR